MMPWLWLLTGCLARQAPAYTWAWSPDPPRATLPGPREGKVLAVFAGDGGEPHPSGALADDPCIPWEEDAVSLAIREELAEDGHLFWLGDNVYPGQAADDDGKSCEEGGPWAMSRAALTRQAHAGYQTRAHFVPGNHDYRGSKRDRVEAQAELIRAVDAVPIAYDTPVQTVDLGAIAVVAYDTQYAMQLDPDGTLTALEEAITAASDRGQRVALIAHHPMYSVGPHAYQPWRGVVTETDLANPVYQRWRKRLLPWLELWIAKGQLAISFAGHDHSLQLIQVGQGLYVTSGAGSKTSTVRGARGPGVHVHHAESTPGYAALVRDAAGGLSVELVAVRPTEQQGCRPIADTGWFRCRVAAMPF